MPDLSLRTQDAVDERKGSHDENKGWTVHYGLCDRLKNVAKASIEHSLQHYGREWTLVSPELESHGETSAMFSLTA